MAIAIIIISILLWLAAIAALVWRPLYGPALSYLGLLAISFAKSGPFQIIPVNGTILTGWLAMTLIVMVATLLQPHEMRDDKAGSGYLIIGALMGMAVGLLGFSVSTALTMLYGIMIVATAAGAFFGFLLFSRTPAGSHYSLSSGKFFPALLAKGFPVAITFMQIGVVLVILLAIYNTPSPF